MSGTNVSDMKPKRLMYRRSARLKPNPDTKPRVPLRRRLTYRQCLSSRLERVNQRFLWQVADNRLYDPAESHGDVTG